MADSTEQTPENDPSTESAAQKAASGVESDDEAMPKTGFYPVVQRSDRDVTTTGASGRSAGSIPSSDFPTEQHRGVDVATSSPIPAGDFPTQHHLSPGRHLTEAEGYGPVGPGFSPPSGPGFPAGPFGPGPLPPAYAGTPRRHPWEIPLLVAVIVVTVLIYAGSLALAALGVINEYLLLLLLVPIVIWFGRGTTWAMPRVQGIQMTPSQFPEGYQMVRDAAARYGMREVPDAFVVLGNGQINAYASGHGFRRFVVIYSDLFEIGGKARDPEALAYIIGHEVGHIAAGHTSYWRQVASFAMAYIPFVGSALSRSQEYTADNYGYFNQPAGAPGGMGVLGAGKYLGKEVDFDQLADRATSDRGFFTWLANLLASHPVLTWRAAALRNRTKSGSLFFPPNQTLRGVGGGAVAPSGPVNDYAKQEVLAPPPQ